MEINQITERIIGAAIAVHRELGPGLLESSYETCLEYELLAGGLAIQRQYPVPLIYHGLRMDCGYRLDLLVEAQVVVEVKAVEKLGPIHTAQVLTYLKLAGVPVGLLFNFNVSRLMDGFHRLVLEYPGPAPRTPRSPR